MPSTSEMIWHSLGINKQINTCQFSSERVWGQIKAGTDIKPGQHLFPRILAVQDAVSKLTSDVITLSEDKQEKKMEQPAAEQKPAEKPAAVEPELIGIEDFAKVQLRVGKIVAAERVVKSEKLVKLQVDIGTETRQVVAGIGKSYTPEELMGKSVVIVAT
jgi:methionyl-tRNA synthetase